MTLPDDKFSQAGLFVSRDIIVATYDTDFQGHVSNIAYLRWLEDMRLMMFDKYFPLQDFMAQSKMPVLRSTNIQYKRSVRLFEPVRARMWVSEVGLASFTIQANILVEDEITTTAEHVGVFVDMRSGRPIRVPKIISDKFKQTSQLSSV